MTRRLGAVFVLAAWLLALAPDAPAQAPASVTKPHLMAFLACDTTSANCFDPRNHMAYLAESDDGTTWQIPPGFVPFSGSVPDVVRRGSTLYLYTPGMVRRFSMNTGLWDVPRLVTLTDTQSVSFVDPSPIVDEHGRLVLFYLAPGAPGSGDPAQCPSGETTCVKHFRSAVEVDGSDGTVFVADQDDRLALTITAHEIASDPDVFFDGTQYVLYIAHITSAGQTMEAYTSPTLRGTYTRVPALANGTVVLGAGDVGSGYFDAPHGEYWTVLHQGQSLQTIARAVHPTLNRQLGTADFQTLVTGASLGLGASMSVGSPGIAANANGPAITASSPAGTVTTPAALTFQWRDVTQSPIYALEFCVAAGSSACFASGAGADSFDAPTQTFWLVNGDDPAWRRFVGFPVGAGGVILYSRSGFTVTSAAVSLGRVAANVQYRVFPIAVAASGSGTLNAPTAIQGAVTLPTGSTSSLPVSVTLR